jgi:hypothetical protein
MGNTLLIKIINVFKQVQRMVFYSPPGIMLLTLEDGSNEIVDCRNRSQKEKDQ